MSFKTCDSVELNQEVEYHLGALHRGAQCSMSCLKTHHSPGITNPNVSSYRKAHICFVLTVLSQETLPRLEETFPGTEVSLILPTWP